MLGRDKGYTVKYNPLPEGVPEGEARENSDLGGDYCGSESVHKFCFWASCGLTKIFWGVIKLHKGLFTSSARNEGVHPLSAKVRN